VPDAEKTAVLTDKTVEAASRTTALPGKADRRPPRTDLSGDRNVAPTTTARAGSGSPSRVRPATVDPDRPMSRESLIAFVLSVVGFLLIPAPLGIWLGRRAEAQTSDGSHEGFPFAKAAVILGWTWIVFWALAAITFLFILI